MNTILAVRNNRGDTVGLDIEPGAIYDCWRCNKPVQRNLSFYQPKLGLTVGVHYGCWLKLTHHEEDTFDPFAVSNEE